MSAGLAALTHAGHTYQVVGMLWAQGERDAKAGQTAAGYQEDLNAFIADVRTRYGTNLPFFLSRLSIDQTDMSPAELAEIRAAQQGVAADDPSAYLINTDALTLKADRLHFDANGQLALGQAFAQAYLTTVPQPATLQTLLSNWGRTTAPYAYSSGELTGDGVVDADDLTSLLRTWETAGNPAAAPTVPEPSSGLLLLAALALGRLRGRCCTRD